MIKSRTWILLLAAAALLLGLISRWVLTADARGTVAEIVQDGVVLYEIDLSKVTREESFVIAWPEGGSNTVCVQPGRICVSHANCPDRICIRQGWLSRQAAPIVCLPHRLVIRLRGAGDADALSQ